MIKIYLKSNSERLTPLHVEEILYEELNYLVCKIADGTRKIPMSNVAFYDVYEPISLAPPPAQGKVVPPATQATATDSKPKLSIADLNDILKNKKADKKQAKSAIVPPPSKAEEVFDSSEDMVTLNVILTGAVSENTEVSIKARDFQPDRYNTSLLTAVAANTVVRSTLADGAMFDGVPKVSGNNVYVKIKKSSESLDKMTQGIGLASKVAGLMNKASPPMTKEYGNSFSISAANNSFGIQSSPFDEPILMDPSKATDENID